LFCPSIAPESFSEHFTVRLRFSSKKNAVGAAAIIVAVGGALVLFKSEFGRATDAASAPPTTSEATLSHPPTSIELSPSQLNAIKIEPVGMHAFPLDKDAVGSISLADDQSVQVFPPYQGKILESMSDIGDRVTAGQPLYTIDSPDLIQAESGLIGAAATLELTNKELARAKELDGTNGVSQREFEQAISDQQSAEGALKAARDAVRIFGKTDAAIDQMITSRKIDPALVVRSPISGEITAFNAPVGLMVQPANSPAPYSVANVTAKWMLADVPEADVPEFRPGQPMEVSVPAFPGQPLKGKIAKIYEDVDPNTHRVTIRSEIADPRNELRPGMLATFTIRIRAPAEAVALPANGVVRESDGTMTAWVTKDQRHFEQRIITTGLRIDGEVQILSGLNRGELAVTTGAVFLSNMLEAPPSD
jgi:cobalt-zinc-cadmium efflux system membrane fusion protein